MNIPGLNNPRLYKAMAAVAAGSMLNYYGDRMLGVEIELFRGIQGFGGMWVLDIFVLPLLVGFVVSIIYGFGGKWLCYFPPVIVRTFTYWQLIHQPSVPHDALIIPIGWWLFFVVFAVEASTLGGVMAEVMVKSTYGRSPRHKIYKDKPVTDDSDQNS